MPFDVERLFQLWAEPQPDGPAAEAAFRELYTDPVLVNGNPVTPAELAALARSTQSAYDGIEREMLDVVEHDDKIAIAFRMGGRQVGPLTTPAGPLPPTGEDVWVRVIDILTITDGRISKIWMVADWLGTLSAIDAVRLVPRGPR
jgi:predicted ester cyclase